MSFAKTVSRPSFCLMSDCRISSLPAAYAALKLTSQRTRSAMAFTGSEMRLLPLASREKLRQYSSSTLPTFGINFPAPSSGRQDLSGLLRADHRSTKRRRLGPLPVLQHRYRPLTSTSRVRDAGSSERLPSSQSHHVPPQGLSSEELRAYKQLRPILDDLPSPIDWAVAYGSGVRHQANALPNAVRVLPFLRLLHPLPR